MLKKIVIAWTLAFIGASQAQTTDYIDLLGNITIEDELAQAVELREAKQAAAVPREDTVWETVRNGFGIADLPDKLVEPELKRYTRALPYTENMALRARMYLYFIVSETQIRSLPTELSLLPFIESAFQPEALSRSKAAGLWQFLPSTGDIFNLRQSSWRDARFDIIESTRAALDYLQYLYAEFGDWHLALAAYNCGEGTVRRAIESNRKRGKPTDFEHLRLPRETQRYVPKLLAVKRLIEEPEKYGLTLPVIANEPYFVRVDKDKDLDLETAAQLAETDLEEFRLLNPGYNRPVVVAAHQGYILIPAAKADAFVSNLINWQATGKPLSNWSTYKMTAKDTLAGVAKRFHMTEDELRAANKIPKNRKVQTGSTLLVKNDDPVTLAQGITLSEADSQLKLVPLPSKRKIVYRVRKGDTLSTIAQRFGIKASDIRKQNRLKGSRIFAGQRLTLTVQERTRTRLRDTTYRVRSGDTLFTIAQRHHTSVSAIKDANRLEGNQLSIGQRLVIPH